MRKHSPLVLLVAFGAAMLVGCDLFTVPDGGGGDEPPPEWQDPTTPEILIEDLEYTYNEADHLKYVELLHEDFVFYFDEEDVGGDIPSSWGYQDEIDATENLFEKAQAFNITLDLIIPGDYTDPEEGEDEMWVYDVAYDLRVRIDDTTYLAQATANYNCVVDGTVDSGADRWRFLQWYDIVPNT
ncbi:MAG: hypothetical protein GF399_09925 [Candidatus Coatesbacteria bacterium]|nr:hypothetical protein [Candidatus Coatesbacteria bacterium]